ncbi:MAG: hypothetical protein H7308_16520 [Chthonomonadaceae bacterium]|nr:hypothetical protein [Chthonomonadaceae bacterium]
MSDELTTTDTKADLPEDLKALIARKAINDKLEERYSQHTTNYYSSLFLLFVFTPITWLISYKSGHYEFLLLPLSVFALSIFAYKSCIKRYARGFRAFTPQEIERLFSANDKRVIGTILEFVKAHDAWFLTSPRREHLQNLLSLLTPEDTHLLMEKHRKVLVNLVRSDGEELTFVALKALEQVGDSTTLEALKWWRTTHSSNVKSEVREAYAHCVEVIQRRCATEKTGEQLLRPSFPTVQEKTLLLPVEEKPDEEAETLLRPEFRAKEDSP